MGRLGCSALFALVLLWTSAEASFASQNSVADVTSPRGRTATLKFLSNLINRELHKSTEIAVPLSDLKQAPVAGSGEIDANQFRCHPMRIFYGMVDFHSAVHAHWALLRIARVSKTYGVDVNSALRQVNESPLFSCPRILGKPQEYFPEMEIPYGFAWFWILLAEWRKFKAQQPTPLRMEEELDALDHDLEGVWNFDSSRNPTMTASHATDREQYLSETAFLMSQQLSRHMARLCPSWTSSGSTITNPMSESSYRNPAWALTNWHRYLSDVLQLARDTTPSRLAELRQHMKVCDSCVNSLLAYLDDPSVTFEMDKTAMGFFSVKGSLLYLGIVTNRLTLQRIMALLSTEVSRGLDPINPNGDNHRHALNFSRAWALKAVLNLVDQQRTHKTALDLPLIGKIRTAYRQHMRSAMEQLQKEQHNFGGITHWVGQFALYALTEGV